MSVASLLESARVPHRIDHPEIPASSARAWVASAFAGEGRQVLFAGTSAAVTAALVDPGLVKNVRRDLVWELPPLGPVVRAATRGMGDLLAPGMDYGAVLGAMCLPPSLTALLLSGNNLGGFALILEGPSASQDGDVAMGLRAIASVANRTLTYLAVLDA